jgi:hypothetical protein
MPIPIIALMLVLILGVGLMATYFSAVVVVKLLRMLLGTLNTSSLPSSISRSLLDAKEYARLIKRTAQQQPAGPMRDRLDRLTKPVDDWLVNLNRLEQALLKLYGHRNLDRELRRVTLEIDQLHRQSLKTKGEETASLQALLKSKKKHYAVLEELQSFRSQTELRIRKIASDLGATQAEMLLVTARGNFNDNRFQRLDESLQDNLNGLRDIMAAMDEMGYSSAASY